METPRRTRVLIADDHRMMVEALSAYLGREFEIVGVVGDGDALLRLLDHCVAECLLLDLALPRRNGLELIPLARALQPDLKILIVTMFVDRALAEAAFAAGASGYVPKDASIAELVLAIHEVSEGRRYLSSTVPKSSHRVGLNAVHPALQRLTRRQQEVVRLLGEGRSETEVAVELGVGLTTITFHKHNIMRALGVSTDAALRALSVLVVNAAQILPRPQFRFSRASSPTSRESREVARSVND